MVDDPKNGAKGDPAAQQLTDVSLVNFVDAEAPEARSPQLPDEEAGVAKKATDDNKSVKTTIY